MKIVLIGPIPPYRGGIAHFTQALAEKLVQEGHQLLTISYRRQYPGWLYPGKSDKDFSQETKIKDAVFLFSPLNYLDWKKTLQAIRKYQPDLVIYPWWVTFWAPATGWLLGKLKNLGIPTSVLVHNALPHDGGWLDKKLTKYALKDARNFITMTEKETKRLSSVVHKTSRIETSAHPVYAQFPLSGLSKVEVRKKLGLPIEAPIALFFGFVRPYKGLSVLIDAMGILRNKGVNIHLVVAGEFWDDQSFYENQIAELGIKDMVTIRADYIPDSEAGLYFEAADCFVAPYIKGTQSGSIKQAMGYGLPLVVTDIIADPMIREYALGSIVVLAGDSEALANGIQQLESNVQNSFQDAITHQLSWSQLVNALLNHSSKKDD